MLKKSLTVLVFLALCAPAFSQACLDPVSRIPYGRATAVSVSGTLAVFASGEMLVGVDVQDAGRPVVAGAIRLPARVNDVALQGRYAYVVEASGGLHVVDWVAPATPFEVGMLALPAAAGRVAVSGSYVYAVHNNLSVINVSDPSAPVLVGTAPGGTGFTEVAVQGNYVYAKYRTTGFAVVDVTTPSSPVRRAIYASFNSGTAIAVNGNYVYLHGTLLEVVDVTDPLAPAAAGTLPVSRAASDLACAGPVVFAVEGSLGLVAYDVAAPAAPAAAGSWAPGGEPSRIALAGGLAYVGAGSAGLLIGDVANPAAPVAVGRVQREGEAGILAVSGDTVFMADVGPHLWTYDLADPAAPRPLGFADGAVSPSRPRDIAFANGTAWVAAGDHVAIFNVASPAAPAPAGRIDVTAEGVAVAGSFAWVCGDKLRLYDVTQPSFPTLARRIDLDCLDIVVENDLAYVGSGTTLTVLDVANPTSPFIIYQTAQPARSLVLDGDRLLVGGAGDLSIWSVADPYAPSSLGSYAPLDRFTVSGSLVAGLNGQNLRLLDVGDPTSISLVGSIPLPFPPVSIAAVRQNALVGYAGGMVDAFDLAACCGAAPSGVQLVSPPDGAVAGGPRVALDWAPGKGAVSYGLLLDTVSPPQILVAANIPLSRTEIDLPPCRQYFWKVMATNDCGFFETPVRSFTVDGAGPPLSFSLVSPPDAAGDQPLSISLDWEQAGCAEAYDVYLGTSSPPPLYRRGLAADQFGVSGLEPGTKYFWSVQAERGGYFKPSHEWSFTTACPVPGAFSLLNPVQDAVGVAPTCIIDWENAPGADSYAVYLGATSPPPLYRSLVAQSQVRVPGLAPGAAYYWTVEAVNGCGATTARTGVLRFETGAPLAASFESTAPGCTAGAMTFRDTSSGGQPPYALQWDFGDGSLPDVDPSPVHVFALPGSYTVTLTVTDAAAVIESVATTVDIHEGTPGPVGPTLRARRAGRDVVLEWLPPAGTPVATDYAVFAAGTPYGWHRFLAVKQAGNPLLWTSTGSVAFTHVDGIDPLAPDSAPMLFYRVAAQTGCGDSRDAPLMQEVYDVLTDPASGNAEDVWAFWVASGTAIDVLVDRMDDGLGLSNLDPELTLYDASLAPVGTADDEMLCSVSSTCPSECPKLTHTAFAEGVYTVKVRDGCVGVPGTAGRYRLMVRLSQPGGVVTQRINDR